MVSCIIDLHRRGAEFEACIDSGLMTNFDGDKTLSGIWIVLSETKHRKYGEIKVRRGKKKKKSSIKYGEIRFR